MNRRRTSSSSVLIASHRPSIVVACLAGLALACATSPMGRRQLLIYDDATMAEMGVASFAQIKTDMPATGDAVANAYVQCVAEAVVGALRPSDDAPSTWEVVVFDEPTANAFALPGGKIGVHTGLLAIAANQDQLAAVIGHEVGHVLADHSNERMSQTQMSQMGMSVAGAVASNNGLSQSEQQALALMGLGAQYGLLLPYSRKHESEADLIGLDLMARAGFEPSAAVVLWQNMGGGGVQPPEFMSTHPSHQTRIRDLEGRMDHANALRDAARAAGHNPQCNP